MSSASASSHPAFPVASQGARGGEPGKNNLVVTTYNIGAKNEESFQGPGKGKFREKLQDDIDTLIGAGIHVLCLQEVSSKWEDEILEILPKGWKTMCAANCLTAVHAESWGMIVDSSEMCIFQEFKDNKNVYRQWRSCLRVALEAKDGTRVMIVNLHVVSGSQVVKNNIGVVTESHKIPGKSEEKREEFKRTCVRNALGLMWEAADEFDRYPGQKWPSSPTVPAASQGPKKDVPVLVLLGDFNLLPASFKKAFEDASEKVQAMHVVGVASDKAGGPGKRDWIICNKPIAAPDVAPYVLAADKAHAAVICEWSAMSVHAAAAVESAAEAAWPPASSATVETAPVISARIEQKLRNLRATLHLRRAARLWEEAELQRKEEETQAAAEQHSPKRQRKEGEARCRGRCV
jgi:endonuclease/exonuclease/phosphatase family metal-dependent hydrolase